MLSITIPLAALSLAIIVGIWVILTAVKRIENAVAKINSRVSGTENSIYEIEAAVKWFLREKNMEVVATTSHGYNVQSVCVECRKITRPECCVGGPVRSERLSRPEMFHYTPSDVSRLLAQLDQCTDRLIAGIDRTSKDSVDALALALNIKSGLGEKKK